MYAGLAKYLRHGEWAGKLAVSIANVKKTLWRRGHAVPSCLNFYLKYDD